MEAPYSLICLVVALVLFGIAAFVYRDPQPAPSPWGWGRFIAAGLMFYMLSILVHH
jgi:hypothetical protein